MKTSGHSVLLFAVPDDRLFCFINPNGKRVYKRLRCKEWEKICKKSSFAQTISLDNGVHILYNTNITTQIKCH